jgi:hypothetical protein
MRNRVLHDALREFALEAAGLLTEDQRSGAELEFDVEEDGGPRGPALYRYRPLTERFIAERWPRLRELRSSEPAAEALGAGASSWLRVNGLRGEQAEPALQAMLERLYEDATSFGFPEERFERVYGEVELTLYRDTVPASAAAVLHGFDMDAERVDLGDGLSLVRAATLGAALDPDAVACVLQRDVSPEDEGPVEEAEERFHVLVRALRLFKAGGVSLASVGWRRSAEARWTPFEIQADGPSRGDSWVLVGEEESDLREFVELVRRASPPGAVGWALTRFEAGCSRRLDAEALPDYLLALRALLDAGGEAGAASLGLRLAALCAEEGQRRGLQQRVELALSLERYVMGAGLGEDLGDWIGSQSPRDLVLDLERHTRALLRDIICGYLQPDLKSVADDILLERSGAIEVRDMREEDTDELEPVDPRLARVTAERRGRGGPEESHLEGVTASADWAPLDDDPDSYSAPV